MSKMEQLLRLETEIRELRKIIQDKEEEMLKLRREVFDVSKLLFIFAPV